MNDEENKIARPETSSSIESNLISEARYDPFMEVMTIHFKNGGLYEYIEVPEKTYQQLIKAESAGKFFHLNIKGKYDFLRRK